MDRVARLLLLALSQAGLSLLLLIAAFRSIVVPLVSAAFNLLSIAAAYGVVTLAFQTDAGASLLGVAEQPIVSFVPMFMFAILFGLSMDYNVFLLSRVREEYVRTGDARGAVDVTVVRMLLAPAVLTWLGDRAWRMPRWLDRVLPDVDLEGGGRLRPAPDGRPS